MLVGSWRSAVAGVIVSPYCVMTLRKCFVFARLASHARTMLALHAFNLSSPFLPLLPTNLPAGEADGPDGYQCEPQPISFCDSQARRQLAGCYGRTVLLVS